MSTGADGAATVAQVFAGERLDGFATTGALIGRLRCEVPDGLSPTCAVAPEPSVAIDVTCTDEADAPVNGAELRAEAYEGGHWMATTDSIGRASLKALSPEKYNLEVHAPGFVPTSVEVAQPAFGGIVANRGDTGPFTNEKKEVPVNIPQRGTVLADITFDPSYELRGRVVDDNDAPIADIVIDPDRE